MLDKDLLKNLKKRGFVVINIKKKNELKKIRIQFCKFLKKELKIKKINSNKIKDIDYFLNNFHKIRHNGKNLNLLRTTLIKKINKNEIMIEKFFKIFENDLKKLLGQDIVGQRKVNLVIQEPGDKSVAPIHRDSPPNSPHEIVFWLPLVNCYHTKSISILDSQFTERVNKMFNNESFNYKKIENFFKKNSSFIDCHFGQVLLFLTKNFHYVPINKESETRFSFNFRFKNLFSKYGSKLYPEYFKIMKFTKNSKLQIFKNA
tara:strand:- start:1256 stop:2035 length:780 start_codon:yes stop_codon:yes gene_type:complete